MGRKKSAASDMDVREKQLTPLAQRLSELITDANALKDHLGVSMQAVNQYKLGLARPSLENLCKIADFYGTTTDYLLGRTETKTVKEDIQAACKTTGISEKAINRVLFETTPIPELEIPESEMDLISTLNRLLTSSEFWRIIHLLGGYIRAPRQEISRGAEMAREYNLINYGADTSDIAMVKDVLGYKLQRAFNTLLDEIDHNESGEGNNGKH